jgi:hypothetical protein
MKYGRLLIIFLKILNIINDNIIILINIFIIAIKFQRLDDFYDFYDILSIT